MIKQTPSLGRIFAMVAFTLSCFGILVFLWLSFGGSVPLQPEGYRVTVQFPEATQLAKEADVRISGVRVGRVKTIEPDSDSGLTDTVLQIDARYAPLPRDTHAVLRQKTLLGETYVELSPGSSRTGEENIIQDGGRLPQGQVADTVQLDEILRTFDPITRQRFTTWFDQQGISARGRAAQISAVLANLTPFAEDTGDVLRVLRTQGTATRTLIRDTGEVFAALTERKGQLRDLIRNSNRTWQAIASRNEQLADTFVVFPTFLRESRATTQRVTSFARVANPLVTQLRPAARQISPTLISLDKLSPDLRGFFQDLGPLVRVSRTGLPATSQVFENTRPILRRLDPFLRELTPILDYLGLYKREIGAFFGNDSAATQALGPSFTNSSPVHYLRVMNPLNPEIMTGYQNRLGTNRYNPYTEPGAYDRLGQGQPLPVFGGYLCTSNPTPTPPEPNEYLTTRLSDEIKRFVFGIGTGNEGRAPPCVEQAPLGRLVGQPGRYPRVEPLG
jgi:phospholipid/cholesterol/gamma-HCH transport system substrate-binding protein